MNLKPVDTPQVVTPFVVVVGGNNFLPVRALLILFASLVGLGLTGCRTQQPVSSTSVATHKKDSATSITKSKKDSSTYVETETLKILPGSSIEKTYTQAQFDSLLAGLKQMPKGDRTIYVADPKMQSTLTIYQDSIGKLHFKCSTSERTYYERDVEKTRYIQSLTAQLTKINVQNSLMVEQIKQLKKGFWERLKDGMENVAFKIVLYLFLILLIVLLVEFRWSKIKSFFLKLW